jgi:hypothetical protein
MLDSGYWLWGDKELRLIEKNGDWVRFWILDGRTAIYRD